MYTDKERIWNFSTVRIVPNSSYVIKENTDFIFCELYILFAVKSLGSTIEQAGET